MKHPFANRLICIDDYFEEPEKVNRIFDKQKFYRMSMYPGYRTDILYNSEDNETKERINPTPRFLVNRSRHLFIFCSLSFEPLF